MRSALQYKYYLNKGLNHPINECFALSQWMSWWEWMTKKLKNSPLARGLKKKKKFSLSAHIWVILLTAKNLSMPPFIFSSKIVLISTSQCKIFTTNHLSLKTSKRWPSHTNLLCLRSSNKWQFSASHSVPSGLQRSRAPLSLPPC